MVAVVVTLAATCVKALVVAVAAAGMSPNHGCRDGLRCNLLVVENCCHDLRSNLLLVNSF